MKKKKKSSAPHRPNAMDAITLRVAALAAALWLAAMIFITWGVSIDLYRQLEVNALKTASHWATASFTSLNENKNASGYADYCRMIYMDQRAGMQIGSRPSLFSFWKPEEMPYGLALSYSYNDGERIVEQSSGTSYLYFSYLTAEEWAADTSPEEDLHYLYIDQDKLDRAYGNTNLYTDGNYRYSALRLTGWFEGNEFYPVKAESSNFNFDFWSGRDSAIWLTAYECPTPPGQEVVTVYSLDNEIHLSSRADFALSNVLPVTIDGTEYDRLPDLLPTTASSENLMDAVVRGYNTYVDAEGNTVSVRVALRAQPLQYAMRQLVWFYAITMSITWGAAWLILQHIRKNFTEPVAQIAGCMGAMQPLPKKPEPRWKESYELQARYDAAATAYHTATTKAIQLQAALDYAKNAEEHRRKMISGITHELKTPLAVIHSYAEGLSDGIAADKQEQYLKVILEETQRMDSMVLEMLDLSRLEAGKVRLSADQFSLLGLTRSVFDRLAPMAQEKQLQIHYALTEDFEITADEGRIAQVITNFATNAIKYTPEGGNIWLHIYRHEGKSTFILTNECERLPADALEQIWDSFYRVEASRTAKGTGLGLSIARAIVELHGGTVQASNTSEGVEFRFILP